MIWSSNYNRMTAYDRNYNGIETDSKRIILCMSLPAPGPANAAAILAWRFRVACKIRSSMDMPQRKVNARITAPMNKLACAMKA